MRVLLHVAVLSLAVVLAWAAPAHAWDEVQPAVAREAGDCVSWSQNRIDCFSRSASGSLTWVYRDHGKWSAPQDLGGKLAAAPSCVARGPGGINCFAISAKGVLATIYLNGKIWGAWASLGGELKPSRVACLSHARDRIVCFARGRRDQLMTRRWNGGKAWEPWRDLGGKLSADPECIIVGAAGAACFGRSATGELVAFLPDAAGKSGGWTTLGGRIEGKPSCVRLKSGEAACAAQSRSSRLHMWRGMPVFAQNPGLVTSTDDEVTAEPACALQASTLVCFTRNGRRQLVRRSLGTGADRSNDGVLPAPQTAAIACLSIGEGGIGCALTDADRKLHFAADQALQAGGVAEPEGPPGSENAANMEGLWYLSNLGTGGMCRVHLSGDLAFGAKRLRAGPRCRTVDLPSRPAQWEQDENELLFLGADGRILLRFHTTQADRWISARNNTSFLMTREPPEEASDLMASAANADIPNEPAAAELFGPWRVVADGVGELCTIRLTNARVDAGFAARWDPDCDQRFAGIRYWTESGAALVFVGQGNVVLARFDSAGPGSWRSQALGGLTLTR
jgi:hypothetical protein